ncbi:MAG: putative zinc-binding protein [Sedimentisphaerales bacterium]|nr:putative zinc-binding protein [Sedimentisphaerales bacterium]
MAQEQVCKGGPRLIFACSGAADVGEISDKTARQLTKEGVGQMFCLAGIGGSIKPILDKTRTAEQILAIDGCPLDCVKACLNQAGITDFAHFRVTDLGLEKGKSPANPQNISRIVSHGCELLKA